MPLLEFEEQKDIDELSEELHKLTYYINANIFPKTFEFLKKLDEKIIRK